MAHWRSLGGLLFSALVIALAATSPVAQDAGTIKLIPAFKLRQKYTQIVTTQISRSLQVDGDAEDKAESWTDLIYVCVRESEILERDANNLPTRTRVLHVYQSLLAKPQLGKGFMVEARDPLVGTYVEYTREKDDWKMRVLSAKELPAAKKEDIGLAGYRASVLLHARGRKELVLGEKYQGTFDPGYVFRNENHALRNLDSSSFGGAAYDLYRRIPEGKGEMEFEVDKAVTEDFGGEEVIGIKYSGSVVGYTPDSLALEQGLLKEGDSLTGFESTVVSGHATASVKLGVARRSSLSVVSKVKGVRKAGEKSTPFTLHVRTQRFMRLYDGPAREQWPMRVAEIARAGDLLYQALARSLRQHKGFSSVFRPGTSWTVRKIADDKEFKMTTYERFEPLTSGQNIARVRRTKVDASGVPLPGAKPVEFDQKYGPTYFLPGYATSAKITRSDTSFELGKRKWPAYENVWDSAKGKFTEVVCRDCQDLLLSLRTTRDGVDIDEQLISYTDATDVSDEEKLARLRAAAKETAARSEHTEEQVEVQHLLVSFKGCGVPGVERTREEAEQLAAAIFARVQAGEDFDLLVKEFTNDAAPGVYGMTTGEADQAAQLYSRKAMVSAFGDVGWRLRIGEFGVAPYDAKASPYGWHIILRTR